MRAINADSLRDRCEASTDGWFSHREITWSNAAKEFIEMIDEEDTLVVMTVSEIRDYLQARLDDWNALGDRKYDPANMWGYNFIRACFDDLEEYVEKLDEKGE